MAGPIRIAILANASQARRELRATESSLDKLGRVAKRGAATGVLALAGGVAKAVSLEAQFSKTINQVGAIANVSGKQLGGLSDLALKFGADTTFSASEAAAAMLELAKGGIDPLTIRKGALAGTLQLAAAGGTDMATAATIASNALNTFSLSGQDMSKVAAALAGGANASTASVESLGQALQQVGPGAVNAGLDINETIAALAAFDAAGIKGSDAGTSLKTMLTRLVPSTRAAREEMMDLGLKFTDAQGQFLPLTNVAQQLKDKLGGLSQEQRTAALQTIFGSDATRAATVLMNQGAGGIQKFIKATKDRGAAQRAADANMKGTAGALERLQGSLETAGIKFGLLIRPGVIAALDRGGELVDKTLVPAMEDLAGWLTDNGDQFRSTGAAAKDALLPPLKLIGGVLKTLVGAGKGAVEFFNDLPGPLKEIAIQGALAAAVLPRIQRGASAVSGALSTFTARTKQAYAEMTYAETRTQRLQGALGRLRGAAGGAAGVGGMLLLAQGAETSNGALGTLASVGGGALLGFSAGGPIGGAIGAAGGLLLALKGRADDASAAAEAGMGSWKDYAQTLDGVTGSATQATRAMALQNLSDSGALKTLRDYGVTAREAVDATLGRAGAAQQVQAALSTEDTAIGKLESQYATLRDEIRDAENAGGTVATSTRERAAALREEIDARTKGVKGIRNEIGASKEAVQQKRQEIAATTDYSGKLKGLPRDVKTVVSEEGIIPTTRRVATLAKRYDLTPKQIRTLIKAAGIDATVKDVRKVQRRLGDVGKARPNLRPFVRGVQQGADSAAALANRGSGRVNKNLGRAGRGARPQLGPWATVLGSGVRGAGRNADRGVQGINRSLSRGTSRARPDLRGFSSLFGRTINAVQRGANRGGSDIGNILRQTTGRARPDLRGFNSGVASGVGSARGTASSGGLGVGGALKSGVIIGFSGTAGALASAAAAAVRGAIAAARAAAKSRSPSRRFMQVGKEMGDGQRIGYEKAAKKMSPAAKKLIRGLVASAGRDARSLGDSLSSLGMSKRGNRKGDALEKYEKKVAAAVKAVSGLSKALVANGKAQDQQAAKVQKAAELFNEMKERVSGIRDSFLNFGTVIQEEGHLNATAALTGGLLANVEQAEKYAALVADLQKQGLKKEAIAQILDAGPEAGYAAAQAIAAGGKATIDEVNALQARLIKAGDALGKSTTSLFFTRKNAKGQAVALGYDMQAGILAGLQAKEKALDKAATKLANRLLKAFKKKLGINSPSREFALAGRQVVDGITIGVDDPRVRKAGKKLAEGLRTGFGKPALSAKTVTKSPSAKAGAAQSAARRNDDLRVVRVHLTAEEYTQVQRGRGYIADIRVAEKANGKR